MEPVGTTVVQGARRTGARWRAAVRGVTLIALLTLLLLAVAVAVVPRALGGAALTVLSGSMEPTFSTGDMVVVVPQERYRTGDVVTFQPVSDSPALITHRIVGVELGADPSFVTRGDANGADDEPIAPAQIMGRVLYTVPYLGHLPNAVGPDRQYLVTVVAFLLIGYGAYLVVADSRRRRVEPEGSSPGP